MKKLFLILCLLLTSVFAQEMDTTFVMDSRGEIIPLVHEKGQLPSLSQVLPVSVNVEKNIDDRALSREEIQFARTSPVDVERLDVEKAYAEVLKDGHFKDYRKKSECRAQNSVSDFYKCVEEAYSSGAKTFLALGGLSIGVGVLDFSYRYAKYGRDGENVFRDVLDGAAIVSGVLSLAYGGIYWSMLDKYKEKLGKIQTEGSVANLRMAPYVDPVNGRYGGLLAMNF